MRNLLVSLSLAVALLAPPAALSADALLPEAAQTLAYMVEEEKLAHDVYVLLGTLFAKQRPGQHIFDRIVEAEARHSDALLRLVEKYGLPDPTNEQAGVFIDAGLQDLYDTAITVGQQSLTEALEVGVLIEEKIKSSLVTAIDLSLAYPEVVQVYSSLLGASDNHLEAFQRTLPTTETDAAS